MKHTTSTLSSRPGSSPAFYYQGDAGELVLRRRAQQRREGGFDTRSPVWEPRIPIYSAQSDPYCPVSRTSAFRTRVSRVEHTDPSQVERIRATSRAPALPNVHSAGVGTDRPLWTNPSLTVQIVRCVEAYEFQLMTVRHFVTSLPAELSKGGSMLSFAREKLADLLAGFRYAVLNLVETAEHWRKRSAKPAEPFLWAGVNLFVSVQLDVLEAFSPLSRACDPFLLRCFPSSPAAPEHAAQQPAAAAMGPAARRRAARLAPELWMARSQPAQLRPVDCFWPGRLHPQADVQRMLAAERILVREAQVVAVPLKNPAEGRQTRVPTSSELKLRVICQGSQATARWHAQLLANSAVRIQAYVRRRFVHKTVDAQAKRLATVRLGPNADTGADTGAGPEAEPEAGLAAAGSPTEPGRSGAEAWPLPAEEKLPADDVPADEGAKPPVGLGGAPAQSMPLDATTGATPAHTGGGREKTGAGGCVAPADTADDDAPGPWPTE
ncbi:hypothetical protein T492DRAFT_1149822 [Pavlovales sp. CCMP2436]|nr:hypothetical protein T492DRAFT_1149822 [Pavlovales sp. CCMP2436]